MKTYAVWNNKGGTGKTSLSFQIICGYANKYPEKKILVVDLCPQANLSELLFGGLTGSGGKNLYKLYEGDRQTIGGYFQERFQSPYFSSSINCTQYITVPNQYNKSIPANIDLIAGDPIVEIQTNAIATLANTQLPTTDTWLAVIDWLNDLIKSSDKYDDVFIDLNPSFSIYTQIGLATCNNLIIPVMADDSSRRAVNNVLSLIYGIEISDIYQQYSFYSKMSNAGRQLPKIKMVLNNRLTQYMGAASAYRTVLNEINNEVRRLAKQNPQFFEGGSDFDNFIDIRDFGTTGVVAFAEGKPFYIISSGRHQVAGSQTTLTMEYINKCISIIDDIINNL